MMAVTMARTGAPDAHSGGSVLGNDAENKPTAVREATALWYVAPGRADLRRGALDMAAAKDGHVLVRTQWSAISRGTERLVSAGRVPESEHARMRAPLQEGEFPFPVKYGYCCTGRVEEGPPGLLGRTVFALHPHQDVFVAPPGFVSLVPDTVPARRAVLAANMETALNAIWDSGAGPADRVVVIGGGVVGLLIAWLSARLPGADVTLVDPDSGRRDIAAALGIAWRESGPPADADVVFHASATAAGLATAIDCAGREATVVEASWYGEGAVPAPLGGAFHSRRLRLISSQVGEVSPSRRPRWTHARRLQAALALLSDPALDILLTEEVAFSDLPQAIPRILAAGAPGLVTVIRY
jgi:NADPH:quinone reductase-like Zn-dependent oxidoreductase